MKKKIQISAVELKALSEVIVLNSSFVAKAVRAADAAKRVKNVIESCSTQHRMDEEGNSKEELIVGKVNVDLYPDCVLAFYENVEPFVTELVEALLGEE